MWQYVKTWHLKHGGKYILFFENRHVMLLPDNFFPNISHSSREYNNNYYLLTNNRYKIEERMKSQCCLQTWTEKIFVMNASWSIRTEWRTCHLKTSFRSHPLDLMCLVKTLQCYPNTQFLFVVWSLDGNHDFRYDIIPYHSLCSC